MKGGKETDPKSREEAGWERGGERRVGFKVYEAKWAGRAW